jgi:hypothetical protein
MYKEKDNLNLTVLPIILIAPSNLYNICDYNLWFYSDFDYLN